MGTHIILGRRSLQERCYSAKFHYLFRIHGPRVLLIEQTVKWFKLDSSGVKLLFSLNWVCCSNIMWGWIVLIKSWLFTAHCYLGFRHWRSHTFRNLNQRALLATLVCVCVCGAGFQLADMRWVNAMKMQLRMFDCCSIDPYFQWTFYYDSNFFASVLLFCFSASLPSAGLCFQSKGPCNSWNSRLQNKELFFHWSSPMLACIYCKYAIVVLTGWTEEREKDQPNKRIFCETGGRLGSLGVACRIKH